MNQLKKILFVIGAMLLAVNFSSQAYAAYTTRFDAISFDPAVDNTDYFNVYGSQTMKAWQGHVGTYFEYGDRPLQFTGTGALAGQRQSIVDAMIVMHDFGSVAFTDWFTAGVNLPVVLYNWFYSDEPQTAPTASPDKGGGLGDIEFTLKFRLIDIEKHKVGLALIPRFTLPSGDAARYEGNGTPTGGALFVLDFKPAERFDFAINAGGTIHDSVTRNGVTIGNMLNFGVAANFKASQQWQLIAEATGATQLNDFFNSQTTPIDAGGGVRYYLKNTGFSFDAGGTVGVLDGVGKPRFRGFLGLRWTSPESQPCPQLPVPEPHIVGNKIIVWGKIFFDTDKATIKPVSFPVLDQVVDVMRNHPEITLVEVQGHTDWRGSDEYNMRLSQDRAASSVSYLVGKGIDSSRLRPVGYGESKPIATNDTADGMSQNRRTEFVIISSTTGDFTNDPNAAPVSSEMPAPAPTNP